MLHKIKKFFGIGGDVAKAKLYLKTGESFTVLLSKDQRFNADDFTDKVMWRFDRKIGYRSILVSGSNISHIRTGQMLPHKRNG